VKECHPFVQHLYDLAAREDRAALAELRRGFSNPLAALPYVVPFLRKDASRREEEALSLVASLFALYPTPGHMSLAKALALCAKESDSIELRFRALLDSDPEDLPTHLRHAVSLVRSKDLAVDYDDLLRAIRWWNREDKDRQRAWARDYWGTTDATNEETAT
jgi:CRISPR system Cascade subunit CasB